MSALIARRPRWLSGLTLAGLALLASAAGEARAQQATSATPTITAPPEGVLQRGLESGGLSRTYLLRLPNGKPPGRPVPLVVVLHGGGGGGLSTMERTHFDKVADANGFIIAFPDAFDKRWNDGRGLADYASHKNNVDDVAFVRALIADVARDYPLETSRVYATGISNGGLMLHKLACEAGETFAAIAPVEGRMPLNTAQTCNAGVTMPMLIIQGTAAPLFEQNSKRLTALETAQFWAKNNGCATKPKRSHAPDHHPEDGLYTHKLEFNGCRANASVVFLSVEGGGHTWPSGAPYLPADVVGKITYDFDASEEIWGFFRKHKR